jgi:hypothetical protein
MVIKIGKHQLAFPAEKQNLSDRALFLFAGKKWRWVVLGMVGILALALMLTLLLSWKSNQGLSSYSAEDVVYGEKIRAVHRMNTGYTAPKNNLLRSVFGNQPKLQVSEPFHDFGVIGSNDLITRTFIIANQGQGPLLIQNASTTCGCTTADFTAAEVPPGKVVLMTLQFDPQYHDMHGTTVRRGVVFETNDPDHPLQEIWIQATVK